MNTCCIHRVDVRRTRIHVVCMTDIIAVVVVVVVVAVDVAVGCICDMHDGMLAYMLM
jgi:hypothetical protein